MKNSSRIFAMLMILLAFLLCLVACDKQGLPGPQGATGPAGITPRLQINADTGMWEVSYDNGTTWASLGVKAQGEKGDKGDTCENDVTPLLNIDETGCWEVSYDGGTTWVSLYIKAQGETGATGAQGPQGLQGPKGEDGKTPTFRINTDTGYWEYSFDNAKWISLGAKAKGDRGDKGEDGITPRLRINDTTGYWEISYDNGTNWQSLGIKAQGEQGENGADGKTPKFRINTATGYWEISYDNGATWTSMGVKAQGEQGVQGPAGAAGAAGSEGPAGITPRLRINSTTCYWEVSYDNGNSWASLEIKAHGDAGTKISIGQNGNWFLDGVDSGYRATDDITKEFVPVLRFAVTSDLHLRSLEKEANDYNSHAMLKSLYTTAYAYSDSQKYTGLDAVFFAGDFTQNGYDAEMQEFFALVKQHTREGTVSRAVLGNHEFYNTRYNDGTTKDDRYSQTSIAGTRANYQKYGEYEDIDAHLMIGGYHFLVLNMDRYNGDHTGSKFSPERLAWLETELEIAAADDPTGKKPIFVFQHMPATGTVNDSVQKSSDDYLEAIFSQYPQVVDFSGHTHRSILEPQSIWQGGYTAINTGSLAYLGLAIRGHATYDNGGARDFDGDGSWGTGDLEKEIRNAGLYYMVEVNADNELRLVVYNIFADTVQAIIYIGPVGDVSKFTHTDHREYTSEAPYFSADAVLTTPVLTHDFVKLSIPQASCEQGVNNYRVELYQDGEKISTIYRLACQHLGFAMPLTISAPLTGLTANTTYKVKVFPISEWGKQGGALYLTFTTPADVTPEAPELLETQFNLDGTATNLATGKALTQVGSTSVAYDSSIGRNVASFDGNTCYILPNMVATYPIMGYGFTLESYFYIDVLPTGSDFYDIVSNQQAGGFGFELKSSGELRFYCVADTNAGTPGHKITAGEWVHAVGVYDKSSAKLYINGVWVAEFAREGSLKLPTKGAQYLAIGADSNTTIYGACNMVGKMATANLYAEALTDAEVAALYQSY